MDNALRMSDQCSRIGRDEHFTIPDTKHDRTAIARNNDCVGSLSIDNGETIGANNLP
jgi:hypothetical protein